MLTSANALTLPTTDMMGCCFPAFPAGAGGASQVLHVGTFIARHLVFLRFLIKQLSERLRSSTGDRLRSSGFTERRGPSGKRSSRRVWASSGVADQASAVSDNERGDIYRRAVNLRSHLHFPSGRRARRSAD